MVLKLFHEGHEMWVRPVLRGDKLYAAGMFVMA